MTASIPWICRACGNQYPSTPAPPAECAICVEERQYVPATGQEWTHLAELAAEGHRATWSELEPGLFELDVRPSIGIGHRGLLVLTPQGGILWDPPGFLDEDSVSFVREHGGLLGIARSHPHLCGVQDEWSSLFPRPDGRGATVWVPRRDARWLLGSDDAVTWWDDRLEVAPGITLVRTGGHFAGSAVLHLAEAADGLGALVVGDTMMVLRDNRRVSFMRSYPMYLPLPERYLDRLLEVLDGLAYDRIYGLMRGLVIPSDAQQAVAQGAELYRSWLTGTATDPDQD